MCVCVCVCVCVCAMITTKPMYSTVVVQTSCTHLSISANVRVVPCSTGAGETHLEDSCNFTCNTGFEMTGDNTDICQVHGDWSGIESPCKKEVSI